MRIAIVNDLNLAVEALKRVLEQNPSLDLAWVAMDGAEAVKKCKMDKPDLILMDLIMPVMDGVEATKLIMTHSPCAILVVTATVTGNSAKVFDAMGYGALDAVTTPTFGSGGGIEGTKDLLKKIDTIGKLIGINISTKPTPDLSANNYLVPKLIVIGASTGGPKALATVLSGLDKSINACVVIVQHVDSQFAEGLANWLDEQSELQVMVIKEGMKPRANTVMIAETNDHLAIDKDLSFYYTAEPINYHYRPSVNVIFHSMAENWKSIGVAVVLTGMGDDGARGLLQLKDLGWHTIVQDKASSTVYGMTKAAAEIGAAQQILDVNAIAVAIRNKIKRIG
jgi:two-component system, chemotaxis family, response regulator WspF